MNVVPWIERVLLRELDSFERKRTLTGADVSSGAISLKALSQNPYGAS